MSETKKPAAGQQSLFAQALDEFSSRLLSTVAKDNLILSPFSVYSALSLTLQGARAATAAQMLSSLRLSSKTDALAGCAAMNEYTSLDSHTLAVFNAVYLDSSITLRPEFTSAVREAKASVVQKDFRNASEAARREINRDVELVTNSLIKGLLSAGTLGSLTRLVLVNAVYFKGSFVSCCFDSSVSLTQLSSSPPFL